MLMAIQDPSPENPVTDSQPEAAQTGTETTDNAIDKAIDKDRVQQVLDMVRPYLQADGGDCELVDVTSTGVVMLRLQGVCGACPSSTYTLKMGIEEQLKQHVPGVTEVIQVH